MIEVVLDTNIFRNDPLRKKAGFNAIVRLAKSGKLRLHIPYFVKREFVSQEIENYEKHVIAIHQAISQLQRKPIPDRTEDRLAELKNSFLEIQSELTIYPENEFAAWLDDIQGIVHPVSEQHGIRVAKDYFDGAPPFRNKKSRDDIPDAFIWQLILDLAAKYNELYVVAGDKAILDSCETVQNISVFSSLDDFITSDICRSILREESARDNTERLIKYLPLMISIRQEDIEEQLITLLEGTNVQSDIIPNSMHIATILTVEELKQIEFVDLASVQYYGEGVILIPFQAALDSLLDYELLKADYHNLSGKRTERIDVSEFDKYRYKAEETYSLDVFGNISISVDPQKISDSSLSDQDIRSLIDHAIFEIDSLTQVEAVDWDPISNRWEQRFLELVRYKRQHGNCDVPQRYSEIEFLGRWVHNQRQRHRIKKLSENRVRRLNEIGFTWRATSHSMEFDEYVDQLLEYEKIYGHMNVSQLDPKYKKLGKWLNDQRNNKKKGTLLKEREERLNEIGIVSLVSGN